VPHTGNATLGSFANVGLKRKQPRRGNGSARSDAGTRRAPELPFDLVGESVVTARRCMPSIAGNATQSATDSALGSSAMGRPSLFGKAMLRSAAMVGARFSTGSAAAISPDGMPGPAKKTAAVGV
jgi:hypothetical protein